MKERKLREYGRFIEVIGLNVVNYHFVAKARSDDENSMSECYCDDGKLMATDGRRLHWIELKSNPFGFEDGKFYAYLRSGLKSAAWFAELKCNWNFPNYERIFPEGEPDNSCKYEVVKIGHRDFYINMSRLLRALPEEDAVNYSYLNDLPEGEVFTMDIFRHIIMATSGNVGALIATMMDVN
jgi:hypothetical protein